MDIDPTKTYTHIDGSSGNETVKMTGAQALACSHQGQCIDDVQATLPNVTFIADQKQMRRLLAESGGWSREEIKNLSDEEVKEKMLWIAAGDIRERPEEYK